MDRIRRISFIVAGLIGLFFFVFQGLLFQLFNWTETLKCLTQNNWANFQTFNLVSILMVGTMTFVSFRFPAELVKPGLGKTLLVVFSLFYVVRIGTQFGLYGFHGFSTVGLVGLCLVALAIYLWNLFYFAPVAKSSVQAAPGD
jgi:hypothetical protein